MIKTKWFIYTVLIGLIPFFIRSFIILFDTKGSISYLINEADFIGFGLVLNLTNINELEDKEFEDKQWKTKNIGLSVLFISVFASIFAIVTYADFKQNPDLNRWMVKFFSVFLAFSSFLFSYSIYNRLTTLRR